MNLKKTFLKVSQIWTLFIFSSVSFLGFLSLSDTSLSHYWNTKDISIGVPSVSAQTETLMERLKKLRASHNLQEYTVPNGKKYIIINSWKWFTVKRVDWTILSSTFTSYQDTTTFLDKNNPKNEKTRPTIVVSQSWVILTPKTTTVSPSVSKESTTLVQSKINEQAKTKAQAEDLAKTEQLKQKALLDSQAKAKAAAIAAAEQARIKAQNQVTKTTIVPTTPVISTPRVVNTTTKAS